MTAVLLRPVPFTNVGLPCWAGRTTSFPAGVGKGPAGGGHTCLSADVASGAFPVSSPGEGSQGPRGVAF